MRDFVVFFIDQIPTFLMSEPISAFTGLCIMFFVARLFRRMIGLS